MKIDLQRYWGHHEIYHAGELTCRIVDAIQKHGSVTLVSKEIRSLEKSGLLSLLDEICAFHCWPKNNVTIEHVDPTQPTPDGYNIMVVETSEPLFNIDLSRVNHRLWNKEKTYGMFIGRANTTRMYAAYRHLNFEYKDVGLTSFNQDISHYVDHRYLLEYLCQTNQRWEDLKCIRPWSDIDRIQQPPITNQFYGPLWDTIYEKIGIEIVLETSETSDCSGISEKILRPIIYRRPFILICGRGFMENGLKRAAEYKNRYHLDGSLAALPDNFRLFENVIPLDYDRDEGIDRVEHAFDILRELIRTKKIDSILEACADDIDFNYNLVKNYISSVQRHSAIYHTRYESNTWSLR